ncbi:hypothetical protein FNV43_RR08815 [Rhamnella rubrinervis]|uniref:Uncharacterized protein n=1 Tax=Rhamnella rubrinervis TaxID=2594499 RepID=A0A8K0H9B7_9ROSA|nr:hypothetical protein FNV43_RR08815 [Rhamnella rubrinervis]
MKTPFFVWLFLILVHLLHAVSGQCLSGQQSLLLQLKDNLKFYPARSKNLVKWNKTSDSLVTGLRGGTSHCLDLSYNNFNSKIPQKIGNLANLSVLNFSNAGLEGQIREEISNLTRLVALDLSIQPLLIPPPLKLENPDLSMLVKNLKQLEELYLDGLNITVRGNEWCQALSSSVPATVILKSLSVIRLDANNFFAPVPEFFVSFSNLISLSLSTCQLNGVFSKEIFKGLPTSIGNLPNLSRLELANCSFDEKLPNSMTKLIQLVHLDLSMNMFAGPIPSFNMSTNLTYIDLSHNGLTGTVPSTHWVGLHKLVYLDLRYNSLNGSLPSSLFALPSLKNIQLSYNKFSGQVPDFKNVSSSILDALDLSSNHLEGIQEPYSHPNLSVLDLHSNQLHGKIPILPLASYIDFSSNSFTSFIPHDIGNNLLATFFSLSHNKFTGVLPGSICNAVYLRVLVLCSNRLSGKIPECLSAMALGVLNLNRNNFSGSIPDAFPNNCSLRTLAVNGNSLEGQVPRSLANCAALEVLDLGNNKMIDHSPCFLENIFNLQVLVLRSNNFTGNIGCPNDTVTVTLKGLEFELVKIQTVFTSIDFSSNNFHGEIPKELGQLKALYVLDLSNNVLSGQIPSSLCNLRHLESLELSKNDLNGAISASLANLNFLSFLNLSYNQLEGGIPAGNQIQTFSTASFQGNKGLCGPPLLDCTDGVIRMLPEIPKAKIEWELIAAEIGFLIGFGSVIGSLVFFRRWRKWYFHHVEDIAFSILPQPLLRKLLLWKTGLVAKTFLAIEAPVVRCPSRSH